MLAWTCKKNTFVLKRRRKNGHFISDDSYLPFYLKVVLWQPPLVWNDDTHLDLSQIHHSQLGQEKGPHQVRTHTEETAKH
jgi:hypothetical protein